MVDEFVSVSQLNFRSSQSLSQLTPTNAQLKLSERQRFGCFRFQLLETVLLYGGCINGV